MVILAGLISLAVGLLLLMSPATLGKAGDVCNKTLVALDDKLARVRIAAGAIMLILGLLIIWMILPYGPEYWYLHVIGVLGAFFGILYLAFPKALTALSNVFNVVLLPTDEIVLSTRKVVGIVLIIASAYMLIASFMMGTSKQ